MTDGPYVPTYPRNYPIYRPELPPRTNSLEDTLPRPTPVPPPLITSMNPDDAYEVRGVYQAQPNGPFSPSPAREHSEGLSRPSSARRLRRGRTLVANERDLNSTLARTVARRGPVTLAATQGLDEAIETCRLKVKKIAEECKRKNTRFRDRHFDLERSRDECLFSLSHDERHGEKFQPRGVKRVHEIFDEPRFFGDRGPAAGDISQGNVGDCYFLAALATLTAVPKMIRDICVARDERVGVYGFIFFRDGEWISSVVDDQLFVKHADFSQADIVERQKFRGDERLYKHVLLKNSDALYFSSCKDQNKTWLPLLEKAYAKIHGDYESISGGITGEAVEDLTGGVITPIHTADILDPDRFWEEELTKVPKHFLFACSVQKEGHISHNGLIHNHAYSVLEARQVRDKKLVLIRNPWGSAEWKGRWSDGSSEWTPEWMEQLNHRFGDDGVFWMEYADFLKEWTVIDRTRLFDRTWSVASHWLEFAPSFPPEWGEVHFTLQFTKKTDAVIVLSQLDNRYFRGLEGAYTFLLEFRLWRGDDKDWLDRSTGGPGSRSTNVEIKDLEPGEYTVQVRINRVRTERNFRNEFIESLPGEKVPKFVTIGKSYDMAAQKAANQDTVEPHEGEAEDSLLVIGLRVYSKDPKSTISGHVLKEGEVIPDPVSILDPEDVHADMQSLRDSRVAQRDYEPWSWEGHERQQHHKPNGPIVTDGEPHHEPIIGSPHARRHEGHGGRSGPQRNVSEPYLTGGPDRQSDARSDTSRSPSPLPHYNTYPLDQAHFALGAPTLGVTRNSRARSLTPSRGGMPIDIGSMTISPRMPSPHPTGSVVPLAWVECKWGEIPPNAILGGGEGEGKTPLYVARVQHGDGYQPGYAASHIKSCAFTYDGQCLTKKVYDVLTGDESRVQWVPVAGSLQQVLQRWRPIGAGINGLDSHHLVQDSIIARARVPDSIVPGKTGVQYGGVCYYVNGSLEGCTENFEVLVHR
ncbi:hypothetical protein HDV00_002914 [Rhizophlyctis rosea]|nr:hypothetical protein HDV00_002914 [Rhizophlyctis rosea]